MRFFPTALLALSLTLAACGSDADPGDSASALEIPAEAGGPGAADIEPCEALTPAMIATALGVPEGDVTVDREGIERAAQMGIEIPGNLCTYDIADGSDYEAVTVSVSGYESASAAEAAFTGQYRARTDEELAQIEEAGDRAAAQMEADGQATPDDAGGMLSRLAGSSSFEAVSGVGDQASIEAQPPIEVLNLPSVPGTIYVRDGAVVYAVSAAPTMSFHKSPGAADAIREAFVGLARQVVGA